MDYLGNSFSTSSDARFMNPCLQLQTLKIDDISYEYFVQRIKTMGDYLVAIGEPVLECDLVLCARRSQY